MTKSIANERNDRIGQYLLQYLERFLFDQLSDAYLEKAGMKDILSGIPVPIARDELTNLNSLTIARSMAMVLGCDPSFKYGEEYKEYIRRAFGDGFIKPLLNEGVETAEKGYPERACIFFRGALTLEEDNPDALYCYGRACKDAYEEGQGEEYVGRFKAESLEAFERLTMVAPEYDLGYYFLGYAYLNMGLYIKASLTFKEFSERTADSPDESKQEMREEVREWLVKLEEPVKIEEGYNHVIAGRYREGIEILEPYKDDERFSTWWPLWYYLGTAYDESEMKDEAISAFLKVLSLSPSNMDAMRELSRLYAEKGNEEKAKKYSDKIGLIERNREEYKAERDMDVS